MTQAPSQMPELKPCPFCGATPKIYEDTVESVGAIAQNGGWYIGHCSLDCVNIRQYFPSKEAASAFWNTRAASVPSDKPLSECLREESVLLSCKMQDNAMRGKAFSMEEAQALCRDRAELIAEPQRVPSDKERAEALLLLEKAYSNNYGTYDIFHDKHIETIRRALTATDQSGIWNDDMKRAAMADAAKVCKQHETIKVLVAALKDAKRSLRKAPLSTFQKIDSAIEQAEKGGK